MFVYVCRFIWRLLWSWMECVWCGKAGLIFSVWMGWVVWNLMKRGHRYRLQSTMCSRALHTVHQKWLTTGFLSFCVFTARGCSSPGSLWGSPQKDPWFWGQGSLAPRGHGGETWSEWGCVYECEKFRSVSACWKSDMFLCLKEFTSECVCVFVYCVCNCIHVFSTCACTILLYVLFMHNLYLIPLANILIDSHCQNIWCFKEQFTENAFFFVSSRAGRWLSGATGIFS